MDIFPPASSSPAEHLELERLLERASEGCPEAGQLLFEHWGPHFLRVIRHKLNQTPRLRSVFDSTDFLQEVRTTLFLNRGQGVPFDSPEDFVAFLTRVAVNKVRAAQRKYLQSEKSSLNHEVPLGEPARVKRELTTHNPSPVDLFAAEETFERLLAGRPPHQQRILLMLRQGHTHREIAAALALTDRAVRGILRRILRSQK
jgi:RNA polymerase sigma factor (sigma-70 family)